jgi:hypothetical protein
MREKGEVERYKRKERNKNMKQLERKWTWGGPGKRGKPGKEKGHEV